MSLVLALALVAAPPSVRIEKGEPAPFSGTLLRDDLASHVLAQEEFRKPELDLIVSATVAIWRAKYDFRTEERDYWKDQTTAARKDAKIGWAVGYAGAGATLILGILAVVQALAP